jgi:hypothetical protein
MENQSSNQRKLEYVVEGLGEYLYTISPVEGVLRFKISSITKIDFSKGQLTVGVPETSRYPNEFTFSLYLSGETYKLAKGGTIPSEHLYYTMDMQSLRDKYADLKRQLSQKIDFYEYLEKAELLTVTELI